jgi:hypothetical protein
MTRKPLAFTIGLIFIGFLFVLIPAKQSPAATCVIDQIFWRTSQGDFTVLPSTPAIGDKVKAVAKFKDCNVASNKPYFTLHSGSKTATVQVTVLSNSYEESNVDFTFEKEGGNFFEAGVNIGSQNFKGISSTVNIAACTPAVSFDANPKQVDSVSQTIDLKAVLNIAKTSNCISIGLPQADFYANYEFYQDSGKLIKKVEQHYYIVVFSGAFSREQTLQVTPQQLGYQMNQNASFSVKITGYIANYTNTSVNLVSSPVSVGIGQPPAASKKYQCTNKTCVEDTNGPYNSLDICNNACLGTGGGTTTTKYTFNLLNPIGVTDFQDLINLIGKWIFNLAIPIAVIIIIYAGVIMLTSGGVPARFQKGAKALWYAVIGLAVVLIGKGFVTLIQSILSLRNK